LPINLNKRHLFWTTPYPTGLFQVPRSQIIDVDECALYIQTANRKYGKPPSDVRVREPGPFKGYEKLTVICAIAPNGFKHIRISEDPGTTYSLSI
jgi:hypothetical protein